MNNFNQLLAQTPLKSTPQRLAILKTIDKFGHISIDDIYNEIKPNFPSISLATIYKNIHSLKDENILSEIHIQNTKTKFEITKQPHGHFICKNCGNVYDFKLENVFEPSLNDVYEITESEVYLYGICKKCKN